MEYKHTNRNGFLLGFIDFFTAGTFFLIYMQLGLQDELDAVLGRKTQRYYIAYLLGIPTMFLYTLIWMAKIAEELKAKALALEIDGKHTSFWHMFGWNVFGILLFGPMVATRRFFRTLNQVEAELNRRNAARESCQSGMTESLSGFSPKTEVCILERTVAGSREYLAYGNWNTGFLSENRMSPDFAEQ